MQRVRKKEFATYNPLLRLNKRAACSLDACTFAVTHPVKKVAQWRLRGIDVHAEQLLKSQERFGLDISPRSRIRKCSSFIQ